ncbi:BMC domain-containing protein [Desulfobotulus pelophilus]|uniref:BMC domain-containing protein n=1 Tax=Desulfobotulus pelophilus TaxID=2823377 RepID=UPI0026E50FAB|nr:BMC domain-containing protein [Desulfobotulus pelophilus]
MTALGLIETKGLLAAIEAADAMLKAADVRLLEKNLASGGLVTISVAGEVAAVKAAVDAGAAAVGRIRGGRVVSQHVIARPDKELGCIIATGWAGVREENSAEEPVFLLKDPDSKDPEAGKGKTPGKNGPEGCTTGAPDREVPPERVEKQVVSQRKVSHHNISQLKKMNLSSLRKIARSFQSISMSRAEIDTARKKDLVEAITGAYRQEEE